MYIRTINWYTKKIKINIKFICATLKSIYIYIYREEMINTYSF